MSEDQREDQANDQKVQSSKAEQDSDVREVSGAEKGESISDVFDGRAESDADGPPTTSVDMRTVGAECQSPEPESKDAIQCDGEGVVAQGIPDDLPAGDDGQDDFVREVILDVAGPMGLSDASLFFRKVKAMAAFARALANETENQAGHVDLKGKLLARRLLKQIDESAESMACLRVIGDQLMKELIDYAR